MRKSCQERKDAGAVMRSLTCQQKLASNPFVVMPPTLAYAHLISAVARQTVVRVSLDSTTIFYELVTNLILAPFLHDWLDAPLSKIRYEVHHTSWQPWTMPRCQSMLV